MTTAELEGINQTDWGTLMRVAAERSKKGDRKRTPKGHKNLENQSVLGLVRPLCVLYFRRQGLPIVHFVSTPF